MLKEEREEFGWKEERVREWGQGVGSGERGLIEEGREVYYGLFLFLGWFSQGQIVGGKYGEY